jgi:hypothetical protein
MKRILLLIFSLIFLSLTFARELNFKESIMIEKSISSKELAKRILANDAPNRRDEYIECGTTEL